MGEMADWINEQDDFAEDEFGREDSFSLATVPVWTTKEGERIPIDKMGTVHLFNTMKVCFNHLAEAHGGQPVWFMHRYNGFAMAARGYTKKLAWWVAVLLEELSRRNDLPAKYLQPLQEIKEQIFGGPKRLPATPPKQLAPF